MPYRESRNFEISTVDFLATQINANFSGVSVKRGWSELSGNALPAVTVRSGITIHNRVGVGSFSTRREVTLLIDIFATGEGQELDLKDYIISQLKKSWDYEEYTVTNGSSSSVTNGKITCISIEDTPIDLGTDKSQLDKLDRFRHLITIICTTSKVEV